MDTFFTSAPPRAKTFYAVLSGNNLRPYLGLVLWVYNENVAVWNASINIMEVERLDDCSFGALQHYTISSPVGLKNGLDDICYAYVTKQGDGALLTISLDTGEVRVMEEEEWNTYKCIERWEGRNE